MQPVPEVTALRAVITEMAAAGTPLGPHHLNAIQIAANKLESAVQDRFEMAQQLADLKGYCTQLEKSMEEMQAGTGEVS